MKKTLVTIAVALCLVAGLALAQGRPDTPEPPAGIRGTLILVHSPEICAIEDPSSNIIVCRTFDCWRIRVSSQRELALVDCPEDVCNEDNENKQIAVIARSLCPVGVNRFCHDCGALFGGDNFPDGELEVIQAIVLE